MDSWTAIDGYPGYFASRNGQIKGHRGILKQHVRLKDRSLRVNLYIDGKRKICDVHRLVAQTFIPNPDNLPYVDHIDGYRKNNKRDNLRWTKK